MKIILRLLITLTIICLSYSFPQDIVNDIPDYPFRGQMFSGYLNVQNVVRKLHYLYVEAEIQTDRTPLIIWLNGGPGCSSMLGWSQEHGPALFPEQSKEFQINPYSWHKLAHIVYLESPAGVGYSYIDSEREEDKYVDDNVSGVENLQALLNFFEKFPSLINKDLYIAGESYAGIYVPTLASNILDYNAAHPNKINLKGIMVGNGVADFKNNEDAIIDFYFAHGIYSLELRDVFNKECSSTSKFSPEKCQEIRQEILNKIETYTNTGVFNVYDVYRKCIHKNFSSFAENGIQKKYNYTPWLFKKTKQNFENTKLFLEFKENQKKDSSDSNGTPPCIDSLGPDTFFNRNDVKKALNVKDKFWEMCSEDVGSHYKSIGEGSAHFYPKLVKNQVKVLIYSGDTDGAVPITGTRKWVSSLGLKVVKPWYSWKANPKDLTTQVSGYATIYDGITLISVKGTGHMVPQWKQIEAFYMVQKFLNNEEL